MVLLVSSILAFRPAMDKDFGFVNLDDNRYVYENEHVAQCLTRDSIVWAVTSLDCDNWHPLTWLSLMFDRQIFGPESLQHPWGYHVTNILIHAVNVLVLFMALQRMTSALWPSLLVAVLFGLHPLRAESVAWISERKDVLSGLFFLLTLWAYAAYADHGRSWARYGLVIVLFIVGLMAKPMLVTLPVLLLLLDYWPLGRSTRDSHQLELVGCVTRTAGEMVGSARSHDLENTLRGSGSVRTTHHQSGIPVLHTPYSKECGLPRILLEKVPLLVLAAASSRLP